MCVCVCVHVCVECVCLCGCSGNVCYEWTNTKNYSLYLLLRENKILMSYMCMCVCVCLCVCVSNTIVIQMWKCAVVFFFPWDWVDGLKSVKNCCHSSVTCVPMWRTVCMFSVQQMMQNNASIALTPQAMADLQALCSALLDSVNDKTLALSHQRKANK